MSSLPFRLQTKILYVFLTIKAISAKEFLFLVAYFRFGSPLLQKIVRYVYDILHKKFHV